MNTTRQPPGFVPTLTRVISEPAPVEATPPAAVPAMFANLLKDWPSLGETPGKALDVPDTPDITSKAIALQQTGAERVAQRAEVLVMQRLPQVMEGLVRQAVRDAMAELEADRFK